MAAGETLQEQYRRVHLMADRQPPFAIVRADGPARAPRGAPGLIERALVWALDRSLPS